MFTVDRNIDVRIHQSGNYIDSDKALNPGGIPNGSLATPSAFALGSLGSPAQTLTHMATPFAMPAVTTQTAPAAYAQIINHVGNWWWNRDAIDNRVITNLQNNTGPPIGAAAPNATELANLLAAPTTTHPAGWDADNDGMPNTWELAHGLNPNSPGATPDWKLDFDNDGYINLIEYINERGEFPAPAPIVFNGATNGRYAQITNWKTNDGGATAGSNWQPSKFDAAVINNGVVTVDAVGQRAGELLIAPQAGDNATLAISSGWLEASLDVEVGFGGAGMVNHSGGGLRANTLFVGDNGTYNLSAGGVLQAEHVLLNAGGAFNFTGGILDADEVFFHLVNQGGLISPGAGPDGMGIVGDLTMQSGSIHMELGGTAPGTHDVIGVEALTAGGTLDVDLINGYTPAAGDAFQLFNFESASGAFTFDLPALADGLVWDTSDVLTTGVLSVATPGGNPADFNGDGSVDGADLTEWRDGFGLTGQTNNSTGDADADGDVDGADFLAWQQTLGALEVANDAISSSIPEPAASAVLLSIAPWAGLLLRLCFRKPRHPSAI
jgi:hypothetical protein